MKDSKRILKTTIFVLLLILLGIELCMESRYSCDELVVTSKNTEAILRRAPEVEITETRPWSGISPNAPPCGNCWREVRMGIYRPRMIQS